MTTVVEANGLTKRFGKFTAVDDASFSVEENTIYGLLGRNGAGKTTMMQLLTGQQFASAGSIRVFGESPVENASVLGRICFIKESQSSSRRASPTPKTSGQSTSSRVHRGSSKTGMPNSPSASSRSSACP